MSRIQLSNDTLLRRVVSKVEAIQKWPFLQRVKAAAPPDDCPECQRKKYEAEFRKAAEEAKRIIVTMSPAEIAELKRIMGVPPGTVLQVWCLEGNTTKPYNL